MSLVKEYNKAIAMGMTDLRFMSRLCRDYTESVSANLKERFCKDWNVPIKVTAEPYFSERLAVYNQYSACIERFGEFLEVVERLGGEQNYFALYNKTKDAAINYLNTNEAMIFFKEKEDMNKFAGVTGFPTSSIFKQTFIGKTFVSIDLRKGNFTALHHYNPAIVGGCATYEEFMAMFTDEPYLWASKYIRQVIFGNVNPKRQVTYEKYLMSLILKDALQVVPEESVVYVSADELVFDADMITATQLDMLRFISKGYAENKGIPTRFEYFLMKYIPEAETYCKVFLPEKSTGVKVELKCMTHTMMPFVLKALYRNRVTSSDSVFEIEGKLAKWLTSTKISSKGLPKVLRSWEV